MNLLTDIGNVNNFYLKQIQWIGSHKIYRFVQELPLKTK